MRDFFRKLLKNTFKKPKSHFIKAEIIAYDDLIREGSMAAAKEKGLVRQEGKEYVMKDGDVVLFKFNV